MKCHTETCRQYVRLVLVATGLSIALGVHQVASARFNARPDDIREYYDEDSNGYDNYRGDNADCSKQANETALKLTEPRSWRERDNRQRHTPGDQDYGPMDPADLAIDYESNRFPDNTVSKYEIEEAVVPCSNPEDVSCKFRQTCGRAPLNKLTPGRNNRSVPYIINGEDQIYGEWPSFARIARNLKRGGLYVCGGTLVSDRHVLTAAHCTGAQLPEEKGLELDPKSINVFLGDHRKYELDTWEQEVRVKSICLSKKYKLIGEESNDDWALLELERPVKFNDYVQPACLPFGPVKRTGKLAQCYTMGIGQTRDIKYPNHLFTVGMVKKMRIEQITCKAFGLSDRDRSRECYAKARRHQGTSCYGDSGGPALCLDDRGRWTIVGVVNYGDDEPGNFCSGNGPRAWKIVFARMRILLKDVKQQCHI